jgi:hypothetical protein
MANVLYNTFKDKILNPGTLGSTSGTAVDLIDDTIKIALIDLGTYTYSAAHEYWSSASSALVGTAATLASKTVSSGTFDAADVTFTAVTGNSVEALIIFKDTGTASTSPLVCFIDVKSGGGGISVTPNGGDITVTFSASGIFSI